MATLKICVQKPRSDGYYHVYIRVTHRGRQAYIRTDKMVTQKGLSRAGEVTDKFVLKTLSETLVEYNDRLNRKDISKWDVKQVVEFLKSGDDDIDFSAYARRHIDKMIDSGMARTAKNYEYALNHLEKYAGTNKQRPANMARRFMGRLRIGQVLCCLKEVLYKGVAIA